MPLTEMHFDAPASLSGVVKHFYCVQTDAEFKPLSQHLSPSLEIILVFSLGAPLRVSFGDEPFGEKEIRKVVLLGPLRKMLHYQVSPGTDLIVVTFNPNGFYRLFEIPVDEMDSETIYDPDEILGTTGFAELWQILKALPTHEERIAMLVEHGKAFIQEANAETIPIMEGTRQRAGTIAEPSKAIASEANLSERIIQMRFKKYLGYSTKELTRFLRFKQVIDFIQKQEKEVDWLGIVDQFGYYDQSHLIKDSKYYLATTPRKFVQDFLGKTFCVSRPMPD